MAKFLHLVLAVGMWGSVASANLPEDSTAADRQAASAFAEHLNFYYPELAVQPNSSDSAQVLKELKTLEDYLAGEVNLPNGSLIHVACQKCVCTGSCR